MRFAIIDAERTTTNVSVLCRALGVSRAGYYAWRLRGPSKRECEDIRLRVTIRAIFDKSPRIYDELREAGLPIGRNRVIWLMQEQELVARPKKRWRKCEAVPENEQVVAANILDREFDADAPNQRWVSDTTELRAGGLRMFLAAVMDLYSRYIVGWSVALVNDRHLVEKALKMAIKRRCPDKGLLAHSDQGCTYTSEDYQRVLKQHGIVCSMSRRGECHDNAAMESWFSTLKLEEGEIFESPAEAKGSALRLHRGVLQPGASAFLQRRQEPGRLRAGLQRASTGAGSVRKPSTGTDQSHAPLYALGAGRERRCDRATGPTPKRGEC